MMLDVVIIMGILTHNNLISPKNIKDEHFMKLSTMINWVLISTLL
jgi:hypothetical protein